MPTFVLLQQACSSDSPRIEYLACSGYIIPYFPPVIDGYAKHVNGLSPGRTGLSLSGYGFDKMWLD